jgi:hypothetical protein
MPDFRDRLTGKAGFLTYEDEEDTTSTVPIDIPLTSWSVRIVKSFQDKTSSENYDSETNLIYPKQVEVAVATEGVITGRFRLSVIPVTFIAAMYSGDIVPKISLYFTPTEKLGSGYFSVADFDTEVPQDDTVNFTCRIISYGKFQTETTAYIPGD